MHTKRYRVHKHGRAASSEHRAVAVSRRPPCRPPGRPPSRPPNRRPTIHIERQQLFILYVKLNFHETRLNFSQSAQAGSGLVGTNLCNTETTYEQVYAISCYINAFSFSISAFCSISYLYINNFNKFLNCSSITYIPSLVMGVNKHYSVVIVRNDSVTTAELRGGCKLASAQLIYNLIISPDDTSLVRAKPSLCD